MARLVGIGTIFSAAYADSRVQWRVVAPRGSATWDCEINDPDYKGKKVFGSEEILSAIAHDRLFANLATGKDKFWEKRRVGETLHYHDGFGNFVRGVVVKNDDRKELKPIALVGNWKPHDLPMYDRSGTVRLPYQVKKINEGTSWQPDPSCVYESEHAGNARSYPDPRTQAVLSLDPPPMRPEWVETAPYEAARMAISKIMSDGHTDPKKACADALELLGKLALA